MVMPNAYMLWYLCATCTLAFWKGIKLLQMAGNLIQCKSVNQMAYKLMIWFDGLIFALMHHVTDLHYDDDHCYVINVSWMLLCLTWSNDK